jgi:hypothetical protein
VSGSATFVPAAAHYFEVLKVASPRQRPGPDKVAHDVNIGFALDRPPVHVKQPVTATMLDYVLEKPNPLEALQYVVAGVW